MTHKPTESPPLADRMREYAATHPEVLASFKAHADALDSITHETPIPKLVGIWARARRAWCEVTGEPLV